MSATRGQLPGRKGSSLVPTELDETWVYLREAYHELRRRRMEFLRGLGLSWSEYQVIQACARAARKPSEIAETVGLTPAGVTDVLDRLETRRLLRRTSHPKDRRAVLVELTRAGDRLYVGAQSAQRTEARELSAALTLEERESLIIGLRALLRLVQSRPS